MDLDDDAKILRKNMFICNYERERHLANSKMRDLGWDRKVHFCSTLFDHGHHHQHQHHHEPVSAFSKDNRALQDIDILEIIASHLINSDVLSCRLVCKLWSVEMAKLLFKRKSLIVVDEEGCPEAEALLKRRAEGCPVVVTKLSLFDISSSGSLYKRLFPAFGFSLVAVVLEECQLSPTDLHRILFVHAPNISNFHLKEVQGPKSSSSSKPRMMSTLRQIRILSKFRDKSRRALLPKLKILHWNEASCNRTELKDIIDACPNLTSLELRDFPIPSPEHFKNSSWCALRNLFLSPKAVLTAEHGQALSHLKLHLTKLTLFGINPRDKSAMKWLNRFLSSLSETLEVLELWLDYSSLLSGPPSQAYSPFPTCVMPKVCRLKTESEILGHIKHLTKFPKLIEVEVISNPRERQKWECLTRRWSTAAASPQESVKYFRCGDIDSKSLSKVMKVFPAVSSLRLYATHVDDAMLRSIITSLPLLADLCISPCMFTRALLLSDSGVTGIPKETCKKFQNGKTPLSSVDVGKVKTRPAISDLKLLQTLDFGMQQSEISDVSVILCISKLVGLCSLKLSLSKITDESVSVIGEKLGSLIVLGIAGCDQVSSEAIENLKSRRRGLIIENELPLMYS